MNSPAKSPDARMPIDGGTMATKPQTLGWSVWTIVLVIILMILVVGMVYLAY